MTMEFFVIIYVLVTFVLLLTGLPVGFVLSGSALVFAFTGHIFDLFDLAYLLAIPNRIFGIMTNQNLLAVPMFVFMGLLLEKTKIAERLLISMNNFYINSQGGYAISVVIVGALMGASTGIVGASVVTLGLLSLPIMIKNNYPSSLSCGVICASGTLGQIIPPSLVLILLADVLSSAYQQAQLNMGIFSPETVTIADLFIGAIIPGIILPILYIIYLKTIDIDQPQKASKIIEKQEFLVSFFPPIALILIVLGSIIAGLATPSEAAALGVLGAIIITSFQKKISYKIIRECSDESIKLTSVIFMILIGATFFSLVFRGLEGEELINNILLNDNRDNITSLIIILVMMFFLGFILDFIEIIFIVIPLFGPALFTMGFDPVWIGILIAMVLQTSFLTPPFGFSIFYLRGVANDEIKTIDIYKGVIPFIIIQLIVIIIIFIYPEIATKLPKMIFN